MDVEAKQFEQQVLELGDRDFVSNVFNSKKPWIVQFYAPWCGHCKNFGPVYVDLAKKYHKKINFASVDGTKNHMLAHRYKIEGFPTISCFPVGIRENDEPDTYLSYYGDLSQLVEWAETCLMKSALSIVEITDQDSLNAICMNASLCAISFLPHILDCNASCRYKYINTTQKATEAFKSANIGWMWSEAGAQDAMEKAFDVGGSGYPTMVVFSIKKMKYSSLKGPYSVRGIKEFLKGVTSGKWQVTSMEIPKINTITPWNGKDGFYYDYGGEQEDENERQNDVSAKDEL